MEHKEYIKKMTMETFYKGYNIIKNVIVYPPETIEDKGETFVVKGCTKERFVEFRGLLPSHFLMELEMDVITISIKPIPG